MQIEANKTDHYLNKLVAWMSLHGLQVMGLIVKRNL